MWIQWLFFLVASAYSLGQWGDRAARGMNTWINSSREETVWQWVLTEGQSWRQSFNHFVHNNKQLGVCFNAESFIRWEMLLNTVKYIATAAQIPPGSSFWAVDSLRRLLFFPKGFFFLNKIRAVIHVSLHILCNNINVSIEISAMNF